MIRSRRTRQSGTSAANDESLPAAPTTNAVSPSDAIRTVSSISVTSDGLSDVESTASAAESTCTIEATTAARESLSTQTSGRPKVLCLGVSYPSMEKQLKHYNIDAEDWMEGRSFSDTTVGDVIAAVQDGYLTEMDGRDLARVVATEIAAKVDVYTVSQETAAIYEDRRHLYANFNRHTLIRNLHASFARDESGNYKSVSDEADKKGKDYNKYQNHQFDDSQYSVRFKQVILDYFWIPEGWNSHHWKPFFFSNILPELVKKRMLDMDDDDNDNVAGAVPCAVYLPFCFFCFRQVVNALPQLSQYFSISFLRKADLKEHTLWLGTQTIDPFQMQNDLRKQIDQEECYCTFDHNAVNTSGLGLLDEPKEVLMHILKRLEDFDEIRMIKLRPLRQFHPTKTIPIHLQERGGLVGLVDPEKVKRGFHEEEDNVATEIKSGQKKIIPLEIPTTPKAAQKRKRTPASASARKTQKQQTGASQPNQRRQTQRSLFQGSVAAPRTLPTRVATLRNSNTIKTRTSGRNIKFVALPYNNPGRPKRSKPRSATPVQSTPSTSPGRARLVTPGSTNTSQVQADQQQDAKQQSAEPSPRRKLTMNDTDIAMEDNEASTSSPNISIPSPENASQLSSGRECQLASVVYRPIVGAIKQGATPAENEDSIGIGEGAMLADENQPLLQGPESKTQKLVMAMRKVASPTENNESNSFGHAGILAEEKQPILREPDVKALKPAADMVATVAQAELNTTAAKPKKQLVPLPCSVLVLDAAEDSTKPSRHKYSRQKQLDPQPCSVLNLDAAEDSTTPSRKKSASDLFAGYDYDKLEQDSGSDDWSDGPMEIDPVELPRRFGSQPNNYNSKSVLKPDDKHPTDGKVGSLTISRDARVSDPHVRMRPADTRLSMASTPVDYVDTGGENNNNSSAQSSVNGDDHIADIMFLGLAQDTFSLSQQSNDTKPTTRDQLKTSESQSKRCEHGQKHSVLENVARMTPAAVKVPMYNTVPLACINLSEKGPHRESEESGNDECPESRRPKLAASVASSLSDLSGPLNGSDESNGNDEAVSGLKDDDDVLLGLKDTSHIYGAFSLDDDDDDNSYEDE